MLLLRRLVDVAKLIGQGGKAFPPHWQSFATVLTKLCYQTPSQAIEARETRRRLLGLFVVFSENVRSLYLYFMRILVLFLILSTTWQVSLQAQQNRALIVAISQYPQDNGWEKIHAQNDVSIVSQLLSTANYTSANIEVLSNQKATKKGIEQGLNHMLQQSKQGDYIYLHFSCHGQQMMDDNGDEEDGLDEALIPYDALYWYLPGEYEGENHLRDDELGEWIKKLREKVGASGQVMVVIDACHSGTANRWNEADDYIRGTSYLFAPDDFLPTPGKHTNLSLRIENQANLSPAIVVSACQDDEINYEYYDRNQNNYFGLLTFALYQVKKNNAQHTVAQFAQQLTTEMKSLTSQKSQKRKQTPYIECSHPNQTFFIGRK